MPEPLIFERRPDSQRRDSSWHPALQTTRDAAQGQGVEKVTPQVVSGAAWEVDPLLSFNAETESAPAVTQRHRAARREIVVALGILVALGFVAVVVASFQGLRSQSSPASGPAPALVSTGTAAFDSDPSGAEVVIDGKVRGLTPLQLLLPAGSHVSEIRSGSVRRSVPLTITPGSQVSQFIEFAAPVTLPTGRLEITSDPAGAEVRVDGMPRGTTPLTIASIDPGDHRVSISSRGTTVNRTVNVTAGSTAAVVVSIADAASAGGWVAIRAPFEMQVFEDQRLIGTTGADRLMLTAGRHKLELSNAALEFQTSLPVQVIAGKTTAATVAAPNGSLSINALPWAEVAIDGRLAGTTPLGNLMIPIGSHEIVWRHPQLGERRRTVIVTVRSPVRVGMEFNP